MADNKRGREKQARDAKRRQQQRDIATELERGDETEPPIPDEALGELEGELDTLVFPATGAEVVDIAGDQTINSADGTDTVGELIPETDEVTFESTEAVRVRVQRPTVAAAIKQIVETTGTNQTVQLTQSQRKAYERTIRELKTIDTDDNDEGVQVITDWVVTQIHEKEKLPGSRAVRREAAKFCRNNGHEVRNDEWLGV